MFMLIWFCFTFLFFFMTCFLLINLLYCRLVFYFLLSLNPLWLKYPFSLSSFFFLLIIFYLLINHVLSCFEVHSRNFSCFFFLKFYILWHFFLFIVRYSAYCSKISCFWQIFVLLFSFASWRMGFGILGIWLVVLILDLLSYLICFDTI